MQLQPISARTSEQLIVEAAAFTAMAGKAKTHEARRTLETLAERYRDLAARRAALACLSYNDPAAPVLEQTIQRLIRSISQAS